MRLVKVTAPGGKGADVAAVAFECGIPEVSIQRGTLHRRGEKASARDIVDLKLSTPDSKSFVDALLQAPFYSRREYAIDIREPRVVLKGDSTRDITRPVPATPLDIDQELWQFTHVTYSFVLRVAIAAGVLSYGMVHDNALLIIGGLIFTPFMPLVLAAVFGALSRQWQLVGYAAIALITGTLLITAAASAVGMMSAGPILFDDFPPLGAGVLLSAAIGIAAALATADDVGHRQLVGLAAASQVVLVPAWFGLSLVFGFTDSALEKLASFGANVGALAVGSFAVYAVLSLRGELPRRVATRKESEQV
jgi:lipid-A-disaccharide synthase-like uncharacterized protein